MAHRLIFASALFNTIFKRAMGFRSKDTTADIGLEVWASSLEELFEEAARGLFSLMYDTSKVGEKEEIVWETEGSDTEDLLVSMLNDIIYLHEVKKMLFRNIKVEKLSAHKVAFTLKGEKYSPSKHEILTEIKAATYHNIEIKKENGLYRTYIVFDV